MPTTENSVNPRHKQPLRGDLTGRLKIILLLLAEACVRFPLGDLTEDYKQLRTKRSVAEAKVRI